MKQREKWPEAEEPSGAEAEEGEEGTLPWSLQVGDSLADPLISVV